MQPAYRTRPLKSISNFQNCFSPTWLMAERTNDYDRSWAQIRKDEASRGGIVSLPIFRCHYDSVLVDISIGLVISWKRICFDISGIQLHRKWENVIDRSSTLRSTNLRKRWIILTMTAQCESIHYLRRVTRTDNA